MLKKTNKKLALLPLVLVSFLIIFVRAEEAVVACPCTPVAYQFIIQNSGGDIEAYNLTIDIFSQYAAFSQKIFSLGSGQSQLVYLYLSLPCNVYGLNNINLIVNAEKSGAVDKVPFQIDIIPCYDFKVELGNDFLITENAAPLVFNPHIGSYSVCEGDAKAIPVLVTNLGETAEKYTFSLDGEKWSALYTNALELQTKQYGVTYISLAPPFGSEGSYGLIFDTTNSIGDTTLFNKVDIDVEECYSASLKLSKKKDGLCCEQATYDVLIKNDGKVDGYFDLALDAPGWANLSSDSVYIGSGKEASLKLLVSPPCDTTGKYNIGVSALLRNNKNIKLKDGMELDISKKEDCYKAEIAVEGKTAVGYKTSAIPIKITNKGIKPADYSVSLEAQDWVKASTNQLKLNPEKESFINLNVVPSEKIEQGSYETTIRLDYNNVTYVKKFDIRLKKENPLIKKARELIVYYQYYIYAAVLLVIIIIALIKPVKNKVRKWKKRRAIRKKRREEKKARLAEEEEKRKREEEKRLQEEQKRLEKEKIKEETEKKQEEKLRKAEEKKEAKKTIKPGKRISLAKYISIIVLLMLLGALVFTFIYFDLLKDISGLFAYIKDYIPYIIGGILALVILILFLNLIRKRPKKGEIKEEKKEEPKKVEKKIAKKEAKTGRISKKTIKTIAMIMLGLVILAVLVFAFFYYNLADIIKDYMVLYYTYIIIGIVVLIVLIFMLRLYKSIADFLMRENGKK